MDFSTDLEKSKDLLKQYGTNIDPEFIKKMSMLSQINKKYQLNPETATDFNNACNFLSHAITKNSELINKNATNLSEIFSNYLLKYFNTKISIDETANLLEYINEYNTRIKEKYNIQYDGLSNWPKLNNVFSDMYGMSMDNLFIKKNFIADKYYNYFSDLLSNREDDKHKYIQTDQSTKNNIILLLDLYALASGTWENATDVESLLPSATENKSNYQIIINKNNSTAFTDYPKQDDGTSYSFNIKKYFVKMQLENKILANSPIEMSIGEVSDLFYSFEKTNDFAVKISVDPNDESINKTDKTPISTKISSITKEVKSNNNNNTNTAYYFDIEKIFSKLGKNYLYGLNDEIITIEVNAQTTYSINVHYYKISEFTLDPIALTTKEQTMTFASFFNEKNYKAYTNIKNDSLDVLSEYNTMLNTFLIYLEINNAAKSNSLTNLSESDIYNDYQKINANSLETYYAYKFYNIVPINVVLYAKKNTTSGQRLIDIVSKLSNDDIVNNNSDSYLFNISIIYKEFNNYVRELDKSYIQNRIVAECIKNKNSGSNIINNELYSKIYSIARNSKSFDKDQIDDFVQTYTNDFMIYNSNSNGIISYMSGDIINFGNSTTDKKDIENILNIYSECRDYFYKVLYNSSFTFDDVYNVYVILIIKAQAIERFMSSRLDNFLNINNFTKEDCRNFLISYGLKSLSDQVDNNDFMNSLDYKKRIIADYNEIMSKKGSRSVIDEFFKIFNYSNNEIDLYKYVIFKEKEEIKQQVEQPVQKKSVRLLKAKAEPVAETKSITENVNFVAMPYYSQNTDYAITTAQNNKSLEKYESFIKNDKYWKASDLPEEKVKKEISTPVNTKYLGLDLTKDLYYSIVSSKYIISANNYLFNKLFFESDDKTSLYSSKNFRFISDELFKSSDEFDISFIYNAERLLFSLFVYYSENKFTNGKQTQEQITCKYFGINDSFNDKNLQNLSTTINLENLFTTYYGKWNGSDGFDINKDNSILLYVNGPSIKPFNLIDEDTIKISSGSVSPWTKNSCLLPVNEKDESIYDNTKYNAFKYLCKETHNTQSTVSSEPILTEVFESLNIPLILNDQTKSNKNNLIQMLYYFNKFKATNYPEQSSDISNDFDLITKNITLENFYSYLYENLVKFPIKYVMGDYNDMPNTKLDKDEHLMIDKIFNACFTTTSPVLPTLSNTTNLSSFIEDMKFGYHGQNNSVNDESFDESFINCINNMCNGILSIEKSSESTYKYNVKITEGEDLLDKINNLIIKLSEILNSIVDGYKYMKLDVETVTSVNNFFDFIVTSVSFFVSYTALLYKTNLIISINSRAERIPLSYKIEDELTNSFSEYFYSDESVKITEQQAPSAKE